MSSAELNTAAKIRPPYDLGANDFGVRKFTGGVAATETTHKADAIPAAFVGKWVEIYVTGGNMHYGFSTSSSAEIDRTVAATAAGASAKVGAVIKDGESKHVKIPQLPAGQNTLYFVRESDAVSTVCYMTLSGD